jgi:hypothetical protein
VLRFHLVRLFAAVLHGRFLGRFRAFLCKQREHLLREHFVWQKSELCKRTLPSIGVLI